MSDHLDGCQTVLDDHAAADPHGRLALERAAADSSPTLTPRGGHDTGIADRLRAAGITVVEVPGWRTRGSSTFTPRGLVDHHTAGPRNGNAPSLGICTNGRSDLPGPLCHVLVGRDNTCYVVAAGRANHAGTGGWKGLSGNSSVYGVERENVGTITEPWRPDQTETACRVAAALIRGRAGADMVCAHREWSPGRKPDAHSISYPAFRDRVRQLLADGPAGDRLEPGEAALLARFRADAAAVAGLLS